MENYFNYFTEIEEHFQARRGAGLLLSTLDWALIETWKDAGIPLEAALRGIDEAFDKYDRRPSRTRKVNSLAYCAQEILAAAEEMKAAATGSGAPIEAAQEKETGFEIPQVMRFLLRNAEILQQAKVPESARSLTQSSAQTLRDLAKDMEKTPSRMEDLERHLTVLEEKLQAVLLSGATDGELIAIRAAADRDLAPYRRNLPAVQIEQLHKQYVHKKLLEQYGLPRLSLFYM